MFNPVFLNGCWEFLLVLTPIPSKPCSIFTGFPLLRKPMANTEPGQARRLELGFFPSQPGLHACPAQSLSMTAFTSGVSASVFLPSHLTLLHVNQEKWENLFTSSSAILLETYVTLIGMRKRKTQASEFTWTEAEGKLWVLKYKKTLWESRDTLRVAFGTFPSLHWPPELCYLSRITTWEWIKHYYGI